MKVRRRISAGSKATGSASRPWESSLIDEADTNRETSGAALEDHEGQHGCGDRKDKDSK